MPFRFKQFSIDDSRCGMKVGTDGVLLGAWTPTNNLPPVCRILDIGTGSGLVAVMLAQRVPQAQIEAIDIDADAASQAQQNFSNSPWSNRLHCTHLSLQNFAADKEKQFDLIVSNPPFFQNSLKNPDRARSVARHTDSLPYSVLLTLSARLLCPHGIFSLIVPAQAEQQVIALAEQHLLHLSHRCRVAGNNRKTHKRTLLAFSYNKVPALQEDSFLTLQTDALLRSAEYDALTQDFYL